MENNLEVGAIISNSIRIGMKNFFRVYGTAVLWMLTFWVPYLNVGTTIGFFTMIPKLSRGESFAPGDIFDGKYRKNMGEFFLLYAFLAIGILMGFMFMVIPGLILALAWSQAFYLMSDRHVAPVQALRLSNRITYGEKWTMFLGAFLFEVIYLGVIGILSMLLKGASPIISGFIVLLVALTSLPIFCGMASYNYGQLNKKLDEAPIGDLEGQALQPTLS